MCWSEVVTLTGAVACVWLGMVLAISFLEAPLKFRAPGVTVPVGVGIGRIVFGALNAVELVLAAVVVVTLAIGDGGGPVVASAGAVLLVLAVQLLGVRPALRRRSAAVLAGEDTGTRGHAHLVYVGLEIVKVAALAILAATTLG